MKPFILLLSILLIACQPSKPEDVVTDDGRYDTIRETTDLYMSKLTELKNFNGVVLLKKQGQVILNKAYNFSSDSASSLFVSEEGQFDLRSVAKLFAKVSLVNLEQDRKLNKELPLDSFVPDFPRGEEITVQHLMNHSSGLPRELAENDLKPIDMTPEDVIRLAASEPLEFEPGTNSQYSNVGYQLLYYIIGRAHGSSFVDYLRDTYFGPLNMTHSGSNFDDPKGSKTQYAYGHYLKETDSIVCECSFPDDEMRMGNLYSTTGDLDSFLSSLDSTRHKEIMVDGIISQAGGTRGKRAYVERNFKEDYSIIFLANFDDLPFERLVQDLQNIVMNKEVRIPKEVNRTSTEVTASILKKYEGTYDVIDAGHLMLTIKLQNDSLFLYQKGKNNGVLYPESETVFYGDPSSEESIEFAKDSLGDFYMLVDFQGVQWKGIRVDE
jgi:hypothetical protein